MIWVEMMVWYRVIVCVSVSVSVISVVEVSVSVVVTGTYWVEVRLRVAVEGGGHVQSFHGSTEPGIAVECTPITNTETMLKAERGLKTPMTSYGLRSTTTTSFTDSIQKANDWERRTDKRVQEAPKLQSFQKAKRVR